MVERRRARLPAVILTVSLLVLVGTAVAWRHASAEPPRADLTAATTRRTVTTTTPAAPTSTTATPDPNPRRPFVAAAAAPPTRLSIPAIGVDVRVTGVGLEPDGSMQIPAAEDAGWFSPGVHPGAPFGSAVLAAHIDFDGRPGAFFRLRELQVGDAVTVTLADRTSLAYRVVDRFQVSKQDLAAKGVFRRTGAPTLTLVTCGGAFDRSSHHYRDNIVVQAAPA
jgi:LPXTG-site transpeptidase (sortase) family protein